MLRKQRLGQALPVTQSEIETYFLNSSLRHGSFAAFWLHNNKEDSLVAATCLLKSIHTWLRFWGNYEGISQHKAWGMAC